MSVSAEPRPRVPARRPAVRDRSIDAIRSASLVLVVLLHATMVGVTVPDGAPVFENALETAWFAPASWFVQMMPLFFLAGGFTGIGSWRRARSRGQSPAEFVGARLQRLFAPAAVMFAVVAAGLLLLSVAGTPADIVATAGFRISQPLWFLGVFALAQCLVPVLAGWHERAPISAVGVLLASVLLIDSARFATGIDAIGYLGLAAVWLLVQQLGFWDADGRIDTLSRRARMQAAVGLIAVAVLLAVFGPYPANMYANQDPPTLLIALLGGAQLMLFSLARPWIRRVVERRTVAVIVDWIGARAMTIYLWHMTVLIALAGISAAAALSGAMTLPDLHSPAWWLTRPALLAVAAASVAVVAAIAHRFDRRTPASPTSSPVRAACAAACGVGAVVVMFVAGLSWFVAAACALLALAVVRIASRREDPSVVGAPARPRHSLG